MQLCLGMVNTQVLLELIPLGPACAVFTCVTSSLSTAAILFNTTIRIQSLGFGVWTSIIILLRWWLFNEADLMYLHSSPFFVVQHMFS